MAVSGWLDFLQSFWLPQRVFQEDKLHGASAYQASVLVTLANVTLTRLCPWNSSHCGNSGQNSHSKDRGVGEEPLIARVQFEGQPVVMSS
ncbi:hypothetical protein J1605_017365 [Eschrichtius robustus]|uniref:Uncharacterized protein n=1 Tax=Eschrichtius robustus TaxID=9764 RepID=A0AB34HXF3_ESCRO|nr:hypothetical protein J1605_017365 [Eschrichtius robustus]